MEKIKVSSIVAMAQNRVIGRDNTLIWHIPEDLKHFKKTTLGKPIIMGRKSYESIGKPLPGRANIVISRNPAPLKTAATPHFDTMESVARKVEPQNEDGPFLYAAIDEAIAAAKAIAAKKELGEIFITGGGEIYKQTMNLVDRLYLTLIHKDYEGDTFFPEIKWDEWQIASEDRRDGDPAFTFFVLERK